MVWGYDNPFPPPTGSFQMPVPAPDVDPDTGEQGTVCFSKAWFPVVIAALQQLTLQASWQGDAATVLAAQQRAMLLIDMFNDGDGGCASSSCVSGTLYDANCDCVKQRVPSTGEYERNDQADPRVGAGFKLPGLTGDDAACRAAANRVQWVKNLINQFEQILVLTSDLATIGAAVNPLLLTLEGWGIVVEAALGLIAAATSLGAVALEGAFDAATYDALLCIFLCNQDGANQVDEDYFAMIQTAVSTLDPDAATIMAAILFFAGANGVNNWAQLADADTVDCSDCTPCSWRWEWVGDALRDEWTPFSYRPCFGTGYLAATAYFDPSLSTGSWHAPVGSGAFRSVLALAKNSVIPSGSTITKFGAHVTQGGTHVDTNAIGVANANDPLACGNTLSQIFHPTTFPNWSITLSPPLTGDVYAEIGCNENASNGQSWCDRIYMEGTGVCPFGAGSNY